MKDTNFSIKKKSLVKKLKNIDAFNKKNTFSKKKYFNFLSEINLKNEDFLKILRNELIYMEYKKNLYFSDFLIKKYNNNLLHYLKSHINVYYLKFQLKNLDSAKSEWGFLN